MRQIEHHRTAVCRRATPPPAPRHSNTTSRPPVIRTPPRGCSGCLHPLAGIAESRAIPPATIDPVPLPPAPQVIESQVAMTGRQPQYFELAHIFHVGDTSRPSAQIDARQRLQVATTGRSELENRHLPDAIRLLHGRGWNGIRPTATMTHRQ